ncbi:MAG: C40 family peptidase [Bacteroidia bacterium]|nr:C40 family peptidase [Bacteroidia bacterium]
MKKPVLIFFLLFSSTLLLAQDVATQQEDQETFKKEYFEQLLGFQPGHIFSPELYEIIIQWLGTPYRYAGKTLHGIDCSNFVNEIFKSACGYFLGGNSAEQFAQTKRVKKDELDEGDLVFFKINKKRISHVGIYLGNNKFVHSSRSRGVIISDLNSAYYKARYAGSGRLQF